MKSLLAILAALTFAGTAYAQTQGIQQVNQWKTMNAAYLQPLNATYGLKIPGLASSTNGCLSVSSTGWISANGSACGTGGGGGSVGNWFTPTSWGNSTSTLTGFLNGFLAIGSSTITGNATTTGMQGVGSLFINNQRFTNLLGSGLSNSAGALTVSGLTTSNFSSANVSQFTNDAGYITSAASGAPYPFQGPGNSTSSIVTFSSGLVSNGSTTVAGLGSGFVGNNNGKLYGFASSSIVTLPSLSLPYSQLTGTPVIASSTLLGDTNQFSGTDKFTNPITIATLNGLIAGNSGLTYSTPTTTASCTGNASCSAFTILGTSPVTINVAAGTAASSTLLGDFNTFTGQNMFLASTTIGNGTNTGGLTVSGAATTSSLKVVSSVSGSPVEVQINNTNGTGGSDALLSFFNPGRTTAGLQVSLVRTGYFGLIDMPSGDSLELQSHGGGVGIGTSSPYAKLSIGGNVVVGAATAGGTLGDLFLPKLGTPAGTYLAVDSTGKVIATTTPSGSSPTFGTSSLSALFPVVYTQSSSLAQFSSLFSTTTNTGMSQGNLYVGSGGIFQTSASSSIFGYTPVNPTRTINTTAPLQGGGDLSADRTFSITQAGTGGNGYLSSTDFNTFNNKISSSSLSGSAPITYNSGTGVIGCTSAASGVTGCLTSTDWSTFQNKISSTSLSAGAGISYVSGTGVITNTIGYPFPSNATGTTLTFSNGLVTSASSTLNGSTTIQGQLTLGTATTTGQNGINISKGCFAVNGTCLTSSGSTPPGGSNTQVQYNNSGSFAGDANFVWSSAGAQLTVTGIVSATTEVITAGIVGSSDLGLVANATGKHVYIQDPTSSFKATFEPSGISGNQTYTFPDATGTFCLTATCASAATYPLSLTSGTLSELWGTTTANTFSAYNNFTYGIKSVLSSTTNATTTGSQYFGSSVVAASSLLRTDANGKLSAVTIGSNLTFDGTTLSATGGGTGVGTVATSTADTFAQIPWWDTTSGYPAKLFSGNYFVISSSSPSATLTIGKPSGTLDIGKLALSYAGSVVDNVVTLSPVGGTSGAKTISVPAQNGTMAISASAGVALDSVGNITNTGVTSNVAGSGIAVSGATGAVTITNTIGYPFINNATSTVLAFTGGLTASSSVFFSNTNGSPFSWSSATGNLGIGTTTPFAQLTILATSTTGVGSPLNLFAIASTTGGNSTTTLFSVSNTGLTTITGGFLSIASSTINATLNVVSHLLIPISAAFSPATNGEIGISSSNENQLKYNSSSAVQVLSPNSTASFTYSTTTAWTGTTTLQLGVGFYSETWNKVKCYTDVGTVQVSFLNAGNRMNFINASTTIGTTTLTTNNNVANSAKRTVDVGTPASSPTYVSCTISKTINSD